MRFSSIIGAVCTATLGVAVARAQVVYDNFGPGDTYGATGVMPSGFINVGAPFTPATDATADSFTIVVAMSNTSTADAQMNLTLCNGTTNIPATDRPGTAIATGMIVVPMGANQVFQLTLTPAASTTLTGATQYWVKAAPVGGISGNGQAMWMLNSTGAMGYASTLPTGLWIPSTIATTPSLRVIANTQGACCAGATCTVAVPSDCSGTGTRFVGAGTTCNPAGNNTTPCCRADYDQNGTISVQDIFDFLSDWFAGSPNADINGGGLAVQDIFDFLSAWFTGC